MVSSIGPLADIIQMAVRRIVLKIRAGAQLQRQLLQIFHACPNLIFIFFIIETFPLRHPVGTEGRPVRAASGVGRFLHFFLIKEVAERIHGKQRKVSVLHIVKDILQAVIPGQIVVISVMARHGNSGLFAGTAPMSHIVAGAYALQRSEMVHIHLRAVATHGFRQRENILSACAHKHQPQPDGGDKLRILPCIAAHIVSPAMSGLIIGMHEIAEIKQAVPIPDIHFLLIELHSQIQLIFQPVLHFAVSLHKTPGSKGMHLMVVFRRAHIDSRFLDPLSKGLQIRVGSDHTVKCL